MSSRTVEDPGEFQNEHGWTVMSHHLLQHDGITVYLGNNIRVKATNAKKQPMRNISSDQRKMIRPPVLSQEPEAIHVSKHSP